MTKRSILIMMIVAMLAMFAVPMTIAQDDEDVTLRWRTRPDNQAEIDVYTAASEQIDAEWDGVTLIYEPGGTETEDYQVVLVTELEAGTAPDVFWIPGADIATFAETGLILNLNDLAMADEGFDASDFYEGPMGFLTTPVDEEEADVLWGLPRDVSAFGMYFNKDLFDEAGLDYPEADWTWDDFATAAEEISDLGAEIYGFGMSAWWGPFGYFINAAGSSFFTEDFSACGLNNDATVEGLSFAADLYQSGIAFPYASDPEGPFIAGQIGMFMNGRWATPNVIANAGFNWDVATLPIGPSGEATNWLFWGAYVVNANTAHPEEAWELLTRLTDEAIQGSIADLGANIPSRQTDEAIELFLATLPDAGINNQAFVDGAAVGVTEAPLFTGNWPVIRDTYSDGVAAVFNGELSAEEFASTICDDVAGQFFD